MIRSLHLKNFQSHADTVIELSPTVTVITGESDQGKTSILRALRKVLRNIPKGDFFIRWGQKTCQIDIDVDGTIITRKVGRKDGVNIYSINDTDFSNFGIVVPEEVRIAMNISDIQVFEKDKIDLNIRTQHENLFLVGGTGVESLRGRVFGKITGSDKINKAATVLNSNIRILRQELDSLKTTKEEYTTEIQNLKYIVQVQALLVTIRQILSNIDTQQDVINKLKHINTTLLKVKNDGVLISNRLSILKSVNCDAISAKYSIYQDLVKLFENMVEIESDMVKLEPISTLSIELDTTNVYDLSSNIIALRKLMYNLSIVNRDEIANNSMLETFNKQLIEAETELETVKIEIGFCPLCERPFN